MPLEPQDLSYLAAEWDQLDESIGAVSESVQEELARKQEEAIAAAAGIGAAAQREDEFFAEEVKRRDAEVAKLYNQHPQL